MAKYVILGGVAGGVTAAARLRRNDESAEIVLFERGSHISYANCGLPYYIGGTISDRNRLFVQTPESFNARFAVDIRVNSEILSIDRKKKAVTVRNKRTESEYEETYDKLILSPGAEPVRPPIPGIDIEGIFTLRNVTDTDRIKAWTVERKPFHAVIVGAGFIGLETAENLHRLGIMVTIVEAADQVMTAVDFEMASIVHRHLKTKNVELYLRDGVASFKRENDRIAVTLSSGKVVETDMVILSIGVKPDTRIAREAGLETGKSGGIVVDEYLRTSDPDIFAVGDAIEFRNPITGKAGIIPLAGPANKQGRIVADNIVYGLTEKYKGSFGTAIAKVFDLTVASTGASEKVLARENIPYRVILTHSSSHAGYYPGSQQISLKTIISPDTGRILGAQAVGYEGVDKRIDMLATILHFGGTIYDMAGIEHAYAPPYSSAKDPVNIAGFVAENVLKNRSRQIQWHEVASRTAAGAMLLDVRTEGEFSRGAIEGATNIPVDELRSRIGEIPSDRPLIVYCGVGLRAYVAERILRAHGRTDTANLAGGYTTWSMVTGEQSNEGIFGSDASGRSGTTPAGIAPGK